MIRGGSSRGTAKNGCIMSPHHGESLASIDHRGTIIQEPERDGLNADESRTVHRLFALFAWVTQGMCVALVCIVAMMHPPMDREEARYNLPTSIEERGERVGWAG